MRRAEPLEPEVEAALEAIDATLAGEPVDPEHAELAELSLMLRGERPVAGDAFAARMDERVADRFGDASKSASAPGWWWRWPSGTPRGWLAPVGAVAAAIVAVVVLVGVVPHGGGGSSTAESSAVSHGVSASRGASASPGSSASSAGSAAGGAGGGAARPAAAPPPSQGSHLSRGTAPVPANPLGRQIVQGVQLALSSRPDRINQVSQAVFRVIGSEQGYVARSSVTSTGHPDSSARFSLEVPSDHLQRTLSRLSRLSDAAVVSMTNTSHDITGRVGGAGQRLAEARALRRSLLRQLSAALASSQIDGLKARIARVDRTIGRDQAALSSLQHQVSFSRISLTIQGSARRPTGHQPSGGGGLTLPSAGHAAVKVLVVAAGVLLIALAVAIPVGLVAALVSWIWLRARRRSREAALDRA